jgi:hypothetical protein
MRSFQEGMTPLRRHFHPHGINASDGKNVQLNRKDIQPREQRKQ